jgi:hypothetical protein
MLRKPFESGVAVKPPSFKAGRVALCVLLATGAVWGIVNAGASGADDQDRNSSVGSAQPAVTSTPTPTPTPSAQREINGQGTIAGPNGGQPQFFIQDVENEQVTKKFLEGEFGYSDHRSHISFTTGRIETVTTNGNQAAFTGTAIIGGKHKQTVEFTVNVTGNQSPSSGDTFSISLSNGYSASGALTSGFINIDTGD